MKFNKRWLQDLISEGEADAAKVVEDKIISVSRWSINHRLVFELTDSVDARGEFYAINYSVGATEQQDERPFEYSDDNIECERVQRVMVMRAEYRA